MKRSESIAFAAFMVTTLAIIVAYTGVASALDTQVLYYQFNNNAGAGENATFVHDLSNNDNNAAVYGPQWNSTGGKWHDGAFEFDGVNDKITTPDSSDLSPSTTHAMSLAFWLKIERTSFVGEGSQQDYIHILGKGSSANGYEFALRQYNSSSTSGNNRISFSIFNLTGGSGATAYVQESISPGVWMHIVAVYNNTDVQIWKNGVLKDTTTLASAGITPANGAAPFNIGTRDERSYFKGSIDEVSVYNTALDAQQIQSLYNAHPPISTTKTLANLSIEEQTPPTPPTSPTSQLDPLGVKKIYPTSGREWFSNWTSNARNFTGRDPRDTWFDADHGNANYQVDGNGSLIVSGSVPRMYIHDPTLNTSWGNVEMTVYAKRVADSGIAWGGIVGAARTNHGTTAPELLNLCDTRGITGRMRYDGKIDFEKETSHPSSSVVQSRTYWSGGFPRNIWVGYKYVVYDLPNGNVKQELYLDQTDGLNGGNWTKINEFEDNGSNFAVGGVPCAAGINPALRLNLQARQGSESGKPNVAVYWRTDGVSTNGMIYKKMSVRAITPQ